MDRSFKTLSDKVWIKVAMHSVTGGGVLLGILGGVYPNADPISDQKMSFFTPVFRPGLQEVMSSLLRLEHQQKKFLNLHVSLSFLLIWNRKDKYVHTLP